jgi:hypothetical protein
LGLFPVIYPIIKPVADVFFNTILAQGSKYLNNLASNNRAQQRSRESASSGGDSQKDKLD